MTTVLSNVPQHTLDLGLHHNVKTVIIFKASAVIGKPSIVVIEPSFIVHVLGLFLKL